MRLFCLRFSFDCDGLSFDEDMAASVRQSRGRWTDGKLGRDAESSRGESVIVSPVTFI